MDDLDNYPEWVTWTACPRCGSRPGEVCYRVDTYDSLLHPHTERRVAGRDRISSMGYRSLKEYKSDD